MITFWQQVARDDDLGVALVPGLSSWATRSPSTGHAWPLEVVDLVVGASGARVAAIVKVRAAVLHSV